MKSQFQCCKKQLSQTNVILFVVCEMKPFTKTLWKTDLYRSILVKAAFHKNIAVME